jgi:Family of unknown function (DUF5330)
MGILKTTIVLSAIVMALPAPPEDADANSAAGPGTIGYVSAAAGAFSDLKDFCARRPYVCETAGHLARAAERKAKYSAKLIYEWANEATAKEASSPLPANLAMVSLINKV